MRPASLLIYALLVGGINLGYSAGVYKWTDEAGNVHFSDRPIPGKTEEMLLPDTAPNYDAEMEKRRAKQQKVLKAFEKERKKRHAQAKKDKENAAERKKRCTLARAYLRQINEVQLLYKWDDQGERIFLSENEREKELARRRGAVARWCE